MCLWFSFPVHTVWQTDQYLAPVLPVSWEVFSSTVPIIHFPDHFKAHVCNRERSQWQPGRNTLSDHTVYFVDQHWHCCSVAAMSLGLSSKQPLNGLWIWRQSDRETGNWGAAPGWRATFIGWYSHLLAGSRGRITAIENSVTTNIT